MLWQESDGVPPSEYSRFVDALKDAPSALEGKAESLDPLKLTDDQ